MLYIDEAVLTVAGFEPVRSRSIAWLFPEDNQRLLQLLDYKYDPQDYWHEAGLLLDRIGESRTVVWATLVGPLRGTELDPFVERYSHMTLVRYGSATLAADWLGPKGRAEVYLVDVLFSQPEPAHIGPADAYAVAVCTQSAPHVITGGDQTDRAGPPPDDPPATLSSEPPYRPPATGDAARWPFRRKLVEARLYRYISVPKLERLARSKRSLSSATVSVAGIGGGISAHETQSLDRALRQVVKHLRKSGSITPADAPERKNFLEGRGRFCEYVMNEVVIWIGRLGDPPGLLLLGGSSIHLDRNNFDKAPLPGPTPGSNRSTYLNALTSLWRSALVQGQQDLTLDPYVIADKEAYAAAFGRPVRVQGQVFDEIPYNHVRPDSILSYYRDAYLALAWSSDLLIDELEYVAVVHSHYTFDGAHEHYHVEKGARFILGSPLYVAQMQPAGTTHVEEG